MSEVCYVHQVKPIKIYGQCVACEIADLRDENAKLLADYAVTANENTRLKEELSKYKMMIQQDIDTIETAVYELGRLERNLDLPDRGYVRNCFESVVRTLREGVPR